jgi:hypothetical protein
MTAWTALPSSLRLLAHPNVCQCPAQRGMHAETSHVAPVFSCYSANHDCKNVNSYMCSVSVQVQGYSGSLGLKTFFVGFRSSPSSSGNHLKPDKP